VQLSPLDILDQLLSGNFSVFNLPTLGQLMNNAWILDATVGYGFANFNMQRVAAHNISDCLSKFHATTFGTVVQFGSLIAYTPLNPSYKQHLDELTSLGIFKAAFFGGMYGGSKVAFKAAEHYGSLLADPAMIFATGLDAGATTMCAGSGVMESIPVP
jgi:hypothetical protein